MSDDDVRPNYGVIVNGGQFDARNVFAGKDYTATIHDTETREATKLQAVIDEVERHRTEIEDLTAARQELEEVRRGLSQPVPDKQSLVVRLERLAKSVASVTAVSVAVQALLQAVRHWLP